MEQDTPAESRKPQASHPIREYYESGILFFVL